MESRAERARRYRKEAEKYVEMARTGPPGVMREVHRRLAERYVRLAEDLERQEDGLTSSLAAIQSKRK
jgi:hypothetical protein